VQLDSVRELKAQLADPARAPRSFAVDEELSVPAGHADALATPRPSVALGVAPHGGGFRLAVRIQHRELVDAAAIAALVAAARGEAEVRYIGAVGKGTSWQRERRRPLEPGISCGHEAITAGTLGAFVRLAGTAGTAGELAILSNNHVLADEDRASAGDVVIQPGAADGGDPRRDSVAHLTAAVPLRLTRPNLVDAAVATVLPGIDVVAQPRACCRPQDVDRVTKLGRTTGRTVGRVSAFEVDNVVVAFEAGLLRFDDQIEVTGAGRPFSAGGDSGSLITEAVGDRAVGLLFAGSERGGADDLGVTFANPIATVLGALDATLER
jgi:hypothetical protein